MTRAYWISRGYIATNAPRAGTAAATIAASMSRDDGVSRRCVRLVGAIAACTFVRSVITLPA
jgi:hypothetical protein